MRFGHHVAREATPDIKVFLYATLTHINTSVDGTAVTNLEIRGPDGQNRNIVAQATVLCAGGIENARILLASNRIVSSGVGNFHDQVGRYLMDHPRGPVATFNTSEHDKAQRFFSSYRPRIRGAQTTLTRGVALSDSLQESQKLLNAAAWLNGGISEDDPFVFTCKYNSRPWKSSA